MNLPIEIEIFFHTDKTSQFKELNIEYPISDCETRKTTFYRIDAISPYINDDGTEHTTIYASGEEFICPLKYSELKKQIEK